MALHSIRERGAPDKKEGPHEAGLESYPPIDRDQAVLV
jgi:hypothetical protein